MPRTSLTYRCIPEPPRWLVLVSEREQFARSRSGSLSLRLIACIRSFNATALAVFRAAVMHVVMLQQTLMKQRFTQHATEVAPLADVLAVRRSPVRRHAPPARSRGHHTMRAKGTVT